MRKFFLLMFLMPRFIQGSKQEECMKRRPVKVIIFIFDPYNLREHYSYRMQIAQGQLMRSFRFTLKNLCVSRSLLVIQQV